MGAYRESDDLVSTVWRTARAISPELPETYEEAREMTPGAICEMNGLGRVMILNATLGGNAEIMASDFSTRTVRFEELDFTGEILPLVQMTDGKLGRKNDERLSLPAENLLAELRRPTRDAARSASAFRDPTTGEEYESITDWAKRTGLSKSSGYRLLNGEAEQVDGRRLERTERGRTR